MKENLDEIARLAAVAGTKPTATALPRILLIKGKVPEHQLAAVYEPMIGLVVQGGKTLSIGDRIIPAKAPSYFVIPTEIPVTGRVHQGPNGQPYLSVALSIHRSALLDLLGDLPEAPKEERKGFSACPATPEFIDAWVRMLRLLETPEDIPALAPVYEREILYRALQGPQGWRLRLLGRSQGKGPDLNQAIQWIRKNYAEDLEIQSVAEQSGMGVTTFHRQFKQTTGLSPVQFQKRLRLLEARKLVAFGGYSAASAAFEVGYESASQFNREYARFFGAPPARDASNLRRLESATSNG